MASNLLTSRMNPGKSRCLLRVSTFLDNAYGGNRSVPLSDARKPRMHFSVSTLRMTVRVSMLKLIVVAW